MPELPEAEAVVRRLRKTLGSAAITGAFIDRARIAAPQTAADVVRQTAGASIAGISRRGKQVLLQLDNAVTIRVHLGMTGDLYVLPDHRFRPHTARAWLKLSDDRALILDDPRVFGRFNAFDADELATALGGLGIEPLSRRFTPRALGALAAQSPLPIKIFLMDQSKIAGLGNIYAAESLYRAGIHPARIARSLRAVRVDRLHSAIVTVLKDALQSACTAYMRPGRFQEGEAFSPQAYGREGEPCTRCRRTVRRIQQGGRSTYFCPGCQT